MRKLFFVLAFALVGTFAFANVEINEVDNKDDVNIEFIENSDVITYNIVFDEFDHCTITVTIIYGDGTSSSATATDNTGDCDKAAEEAEALARILSPR